MTMDLFATDESPTQLARNENHATLPARPRQPAVAILGTRGVPARHGGFETFAERLALYLADRGWDVTVYCQRSAAEAKRETMWRGIRLLEIPAARDNALGTVVFDLQSTFDALRRDCVMLTLGYNTAAFCAAYRITGRPNLINMDGLEWQRPKWGRVARSWLYVNERLACLFGNHLIADHPEIARHLARLVSRRKITTIPYGADEIREADLEPLFHLDLRPKQYALLVARPEPENSILEIVSGFSARRRGYELAVLGHYNAKANPYHARVLEAAGPEVVFVGPVYDKSALASLRLHARLYVHGHTVGGTNPALVEALGAGCPVLAHDNRFNRWVAGSEARYFRDARECDEQLTSLLDDPRQLALMSAASRQRHAEAFTWDRVLSAYEQLLTQYAAGKPVVPAPAKVSATEVIDAALEPVGYL